MLDPVHTGLLISPANLPAQRAFLATSKGPGHPDTPLNGTAPATSASPAIFDGIRF